MSRRRQTAPAIAFAAASILPGAALALVTWWRMRQEIPLVSWDAVCVRDFLNLWAAAQLAADGSTATLFHPDAYDAWLRSVFGHDLVRHTWSYPPPMALVALPFALLPIVPGFLAWAAATLAALLAVLRQCRLGWLTCLAVACSPAVIENALAGQNGALTACFLEGGLLLLARRPAFAGVFLGLLTMKPHLGLLIPLCLAASGRWRAILAAALTACLLAVASGAALGVHAWAWYLTDVRAFMTAQVLEQPYASNSFQSNMASPFILARYLGAGLTAAYALQSVVTAACAALAWHAWRRPAEPKARTALTAALALLATPYCYSWDMTGLAVGIAMLAAMALRDGFRPFEGPLLAAAWVWPGAAFWLGVAQMPPLGCLATAGVAYCAWSRLQQRATGLLLPAQPVQTHAHGHAPSLP